MKDKPHQVSLKRPDGFYTADNELVTVFAPLIGIYAFGVYHLLKQRAFMQEDDRTISIQGISRAMGISKDAATAAIDTLKKVGLLEMRSSPRVNSAPSYVVIHAKDALAAHPEYAQNPQERPEIRIRTNEKRILKSGHAASCNQDSRRRKSGRQHPEIRTPNIEEEFKEERKEQDKHPLPPKGGEGLDSEVQDETEDKAPEANGMVRSLHETLPDDPRELELPSHACNRPATAPSAQGARNGQKVSRDGMTHVSDTLVGLLTPERIPEVGSTMRQLAHIFLQELHDLFADQYGMPAAVTATRGANWEDPLDAWNRCFNHVSIGDMIEADGNARMVILETPHPKDLAAGLEKYRAKVQIAMRKAFGREVQLVPRMPQ